VTVWTVWLNCGRLGRPVRKFTAGLEEDNLAILKIVIETLQAFSAWCRITRWLFLAAIGTSVHTVAKLRRRQKTCSASNRTRAVARLRRRRSSQMAGIHRKDRNTRE
jgi:hypothetical protein